MSNQLATLAKELEVLHNQKKDYILPSSSITFNGTLFEVKKKTKIEVYQPTDHFHSQVSEKLNIPKAYYDRMKTSQPMLLKENINTWFKSNEQNYMMRTYEGAQNISRALLSDRYTLIDNYDVLYTAMEAIKATGVNVVIESAEASETKLYIRVSCPDVEIKAPQLLKEYRSPSGGVGAGVISGFVITNSEVGNGSFQIMPRAVVLACRNGLTFKKDAFRKVHLGEQLSTDINWSTKTISKNMELVCSQVIDAVKQYLSKDYLEKVIDNITTTAILEPLEYPIDAVRNVCKEYSISEERKNSILDYFVKGADTRGIGVTQALTFEAHRQGNPDVQHDTEIIATDILANIKKFDKPYRFKTNQFGKN
jgi:predicted regulator of amino acid metabolism with ACT domain